MSMLNKKSCSHFSTSDGDSSWIESGLTLDNEASSDDISEISSVGGDMLCAEDDDSLVLLVCVPQFDHTDKWATSTFKEN